MQKSQKEAFYLAVLETDQVNFTEIAISRLKGQLGAATGSWLALTHAWRGSKGHIACARNFQIDAKMVSY